jgi:ubiquinone/menaquinone biosynthesis C-methylase UbiE
MSSPAWLETETARRYQIFTEQTTMYQELSQLMVQLAEIEPGLRVLDLGCGTGVTTQTVLENLGNSGHIYAVDVSGPMLAVARRQIASELVTFIQADAANLAQVADNSVDRWPSCAGFLRQRDFLFLMRRSLILSLKRFRAAKKSAFFSSNWLPSAMA